MDVRLVYLPQAEQLLPWRSIRTSKLTFQTSPFTKYVSFPSFSFSRRSLLSRKLHLFSFHISCRRCIHSPRASNKEDRWIGFESITSSIFGDGDDDNDTREDEQGSQLTKEAYIGLFVRRLGMDNLPEDREQALRALWRHSMNGKGNIDQIVSFPGILTLIVSLLPSNRVESSEAAAGLLRNISLYDDHRNDVIQVGAVEEIIGILTRRTLSHQVREQAGGCLWNLSCEDLVKNKVDISELIPILIAMLELESVDMESATGILANFSINQRNHELLVASGIVKRLADLIKSNKGTKVSRQEARKTLLQLVQNNQYKQIIVEEGLVPVPLIGASAYRSFKPLLDKTPSFPEEIDLDASPLPSTFGAGNLLLGLNAKKKSYDIDEATQLAIDGRARQHFLGRIGLLEKEAKAQVSDQTVNGKDQVTIMPWYDGIPRLVLILGLDDVSVGRLAASTISEIAVNEEIRQVIHKAGSIPHLIRLLGSGDELATEAAASALEKLAISFEVRKSIDAHGAIPALVELLKAQDAPSFVKEKVLFALDRLSQMGDEVQTMIQSGAYPGLVDVVESEGIDALTKAEIQGILDELSSRESDARDKIVNANGVPALVVIFASGSSVLKEKAAHVMENLAVREENAKLIVNAGLESSLKSLMSVMTQGKTNTPEDIIEREEAWAALAASSRLLHKLLRYEKVRALMDCKALAVLLADVLKSEMPLHVKDWVSSCLLSLDRLEGLTTNVKVPIEVEVIIHDKIPRLVDEIRSSLYPEVQERGAIELHDFVSQGVDAYVAAISNVGGIFPLVELLDKGTPKAKEASLSILYSIGTNEDNHSALIRAGVVKHLQRIVRSGSPQWMLALYLLRSLPTEVDVFS